MPQMAIDSTPFFILSLINLDNSCGCYFKNTLQQRCDGCADGCNDFYILNSFVTLLFRLQPQMYKVRTWYLVL